MIASRIIERGAELVRLGGAELVRLGGEGPWAARQAFLEHTGHLPEEIRLELWDILGGGQPFALPVSYGNPNCIAKVIIND